MKRTRNGFIKNLRYLCLMGVVALGLMTIVATGGGGGGGEAPPAPTPTTCTNVAGTWSTTEVVDGTACGSGIHTEYITYTVTQDGCNITVVPSTGGSYSGTVNGNQLSWTVSFPQGGGTTTANVSFTISGDNVTGSASWTWSDGTDTCSGTTQISGTRSTGEGGALENFFLTAAKDTGPVITATTSAVSAIIINAATWDFGNPMYELFNTLRDYDHERDEGIIGLENIYKVIYDAGSFYSTGENLVESITEQEIDSPFDLGNTVAYDQAINDTTLKSGYAIRVDHDTSYALLTWNNAVQNGDSYGVMQGIYNGATGDLEIDMALYVDYATQGDYSIRLELVGNEITHEFTLRLIKYNDGGYWISVVGKGVSQGAGNHFLFKVSDDEITDRYFCFPASADENFLKVMDDAGSDSVEAYCSPYATGVDNLTPFTSSDVPTAASDFNTGGTGTAAEGTIYLDIQ